MLLVCGGVYIHTNAETFENASVLMNKIKSFFGMLTHDCEDPDSIKTSS